MRKIFASYLLQLAIEDSRIILVAGDLGYGILDEFAMRLPNQYLNAGITEQASMSFCAGLASEGYRPFYYSIANFPTFRCLEQIRLDVCYMNNAVTIVSVGAGFAYNTHGYSHHAVEDLSIMRSLNRMRIFSPVSPESIKNSVDEIIESPLPAYLRLGTDVASSTIDLIRRHNSEIQYAHLIICFTGSLGENTLNLARNLEKVGIYAMIMPIASFTENEVKQVLEKKTKLKLVVTIEEHSVNGGLGTFLIEVSNKLKIKNQILRYGIESTHLDLALPREELMIASGLDFDKIQLQLLEVCSNLNIQIKESPSSKISE